MKGDRMLSIGNKVVYPGQGPCFICAVVSRVVEGSPMAFFHLLILNGGGEMFVPADRMDSTGIRPMLKRSDIPRLLDQLKGPTQSADDFRQRARDNFQRFMSGSAFSIAEVIESLNELSKTKSLSFGERKTLERARRILVCEISEVMKETKEEAEKRVDEALKAGEEAAFLAAGINPTSASNRNRHYKATDGQRDRKAQRAKAQRAAAQSA